MGKYPQIIKYIWPNFISLDRTLISWVSGIFPKTTERGLLEFGLTMNIQEGGTLEGRTVF